MKYLNYILGVMVFMAIMFMGMIGGAYIHSSSTPDYDGNNPSSTFVLAEIKGNVNGKQLYAFHKWLNTNDPIETIKYIKGITNTYISEKAFNDFLDKIGGSGYCRSNEDINKGECENLYSTYRSLKKDETIKGTEIDLTGEEAKFQKIFPLPKEFLFGNWILLNTEFYNNEVGGNKIIINDLQNRVFKLANLYDIYTNGKTSKCARGEDYMNCATFTDTKLLDKGYYTKDGYNIYVESYKEQIGKKDFKKTEGKKSILDMSLKDYLITYDYFKSEAEKEADFFKDDKDNPITFKEANEMYFRAYVSNAINRAITDNSDKSKLNLQKALAIANSNYGLIIDDNDTYILTGVQKYNLTKLVKEILSYELTKATKRVDILQEQANKDRLLSIFDEKPNEGIKGEIFDTLHSISRTGIKNDLVRNLDFYFAKYNKINNRQKENDNNKNKIKNVDGIMQLDIPLVVSLLRSTTLEDGVSITTKISNWIKKIGVDINFYKGLINTTTYYQPYMINDKIEKGDIKLKDILNNQLESDINTTLFLRGEMIKIHNISKTDFFYDWKEKYEDTYQSFFIKYTYIALLTFIQIYNFIFIVIFLVVMMIVILKLLSTALDLDTDSIRKASQSMQIKNPMGKFMKKNKDKGEE